MRNLPGQGLGQGSMGCCDLHIHGCEGTVGDGAADGASQGESGVEGKAAELGSGSGFLHDSVDLGRAGRLYWAGHFWLGI